MTYEFLTLNEALHQGKNSDDHLASLVNDGWELFGPIGYTSVISDGDWTDTRMVTLRREVPEPYGELALAYAEGYADGFTADPVPQAALDEINRVGDLWDVTQNKPYTSDTNLRQCITESDDERAIRTRLADLWQAKHEAYLAHLECLHDDEGDFDMSLERYKTASVAYADAAHSYIAGLRFHTPSLPAPVVDAVTNVELARAKGKGHLNELNALYRTCRDELDTVSESEI